MAGDEQTPEERRALFRVVSGDPTPEELAALTVVLAAATAGGEEAPAPVRSRWASRTAAVRGHLEVGPGAWRASALPR
jgi:hypothetical protein